MRSRWFSSSMYSSSMRRLIPRLSCVVARCGCSSPFSSLTACSSMLVYISNPTASMWPLCSPPSILPAPRSSRSSAAILKPAPGDLSQFLLWRDQQVGIGAAVGSADPSPQLVELGEPVAFGAADQDGVGQRNIKPVFDDRGRDQHIVLPVHKGQHHPLQLTFAHLAMA